MARTPGDMKSIKGLKGIKVRGGKSRRPNSLEDQGLSRSISRKDPATGMLLPSGNARPSQSRTTRRAAASAAISRARRRR